MSLFTDASLVMIPSGVKDGKLYSIKPDDGVGDFTFTRGSNLAATRVDENGLIEKGRENLLLQSNQFDTTWTNSNSSETSGQSGYDGSSDAWLITKNDAFGFIKQAISSSGTQTFSVYAKASDSDWIRLYVNGVGSLVYFDLSTGVVGGASSVIDSNIDSIGNGWYRCSIAFSGNTTEVYIYPAEENSVSATSGSIYIQDAQLELGLVATDYIETGATTEQAGILENLPRLDYTDSSCPSLLLEPTRTNVYTNSEALTLINSAQVAKTANAAISPEGLTNATSIVPSDVSTSHYLTFPNSSSGTVTFSVYAKSNGYNHVFLNLYDGSNGRAWFNLSTGAIGTKDASVTSSIESVGNGWYRCIVTRVLAGSLTQADIAVSNADNVTNFAGNLTSGIYLYGAQLEAGSYPTSYIPTYGTSVTRSGDVCVGAGDATTFNDAEGVLFVEIGALTDDNNGSKSISVSSGAYANNIIFQYSTNLNQVVFKTSPSYSTPIYQAYTVSDITVNSKFAFKYKLNDCSFWYNGSKLGSVTSFTPFSSGTLTELNFNRGDGSEIYEGNVKSIIYFPTALTDSELEALTTI